MVPDGPAARSQKYHQYGRYAAGSATRDAGYDAVGTGLSAGDDILAIAGRFTDGLGIRRRRKLGNKRRAWRFSAACGTPPPTALTDFPA